MPLPVPLRFGGDHVIKAQPLADRLGVIVMRRRRHHQAIAGGAIGLYLRAGAVQHAFPQFQLGKSLGDALHLGGRQRAAEQQPVRQPLEPGAIDAAGEIGHAAQAHYREQPQSPWRARAGDVQQEPRPGGFRGNGLVHVVNGEALHCAL